MYILPFLINIYYLELLKQNSSNFNSKSIFNKKKMDKKSMSKKKLSKIDLKQKFEEFFSNTKCLIKTELRAVWSKIIFFKHF